MLSDIGLIGLAVMGENLVLNIENKGFSASVYNRSIKKVDDFIQGRGLGKDFMELMISVTFVNLYLRHERL